MKKQNRYVNAIISFILFGISLFLAINHQKYNFNQKVILGFLLLMLSIHLLWKFRKDKFYIDVWNYLLCEYNNMFFRLYGEWNSNGLI